MNPKRLFLLALLLVAVTAVLAACGASAPEAVEVTRVVSESENDAVEAVGSEGAAGSGPIAPDSGPKVAATRAPAGTAVALDAPLSVAETPLEVDSSAIAPEISADAAAPRAGEAVAAAPIAVATLSLEQNSRLTAGEVDDNAQWDDYLLYLREYRGAAIVPVSVSPRLQIQVQDSQGNPVLAALVTVSSNGQQIATLRTHSDGRVYFFPRAYTNQPADFAVDVTVNGVTESFSIPANSAQAEWVVTHPAADQRANQTNLDVLFLIDATGSMADEIQQLKDNIRAISAQVDALPSRPDVRFGLVAYRDREDAFLTQVTDFTPDVDTFAAALDQVQADGGGDYPEDLNQALADAIHQPEWRVDNTVSLIFLVADAPPHLDYGQQDHYAAEMLQAAQRGIKIYPIASSGLDEQGEYIFRQLAQATGGRFIFLTYGASGPGSTGTETDFQVSDYTVSALDDLVVKIIEEELAPLSR